MQAILLLSPMLAQVSFYYLRYPAKAIVIPVSTSHSLLAALCYLACPVRRNMHKQLLKRSAKNAIVRQLPNDFTGLFLPITLSLFVLPMEEGKLNYSKMSS